MNELQLIKNLFLFKNIDFDQLDMRYSIMNNTTSVSYKAGDVILSRGENPIGIGVVVSGNALISTAVHGKSPTLRALSKGDTFGAASLFMKKRGYETGVVCEKECVVIYINTSSVQQLCTNVPQIAMNFIEFLSDRIAFLNKKVSTFSAQSAEAKAAYYLYGLTDGKEATAILPVSYSQLAEMLGMGRASLYRVLDTFCEQNIISRDGKVVSIISPDKLRKIYN